MKLYEKLKQARQEAREHHTSEAQYYTTFLGELERRVTRDAPPDVEVSNTAEKLVKGLRELRAVSSGDVTHIDDEIRALEPFVIKKMDTDETIAAITGVLMEMGVETIPKKQMGMVMGRLKSLYPETLDGKLASTLVQQRLEK